MDNRTLILLFTCFVPLFTAVVGTIIEAISLQDSVTVRETHVKRMLMCYFLMFILLVPEWLPEWHCRRLPYRYYHSLFFPLHSSRPLLSFRLPADQYGKQGNFSLQQTLPLSGSVRSRFLRLLLYCPRPPSACNWWWKGLLPVIRSLPLSSKRFRWYSSPLPSYICRSYSESWQYVTAKTGQKVFCGRNGFTFPFSYAVSPSFGRERSA